jgi:hypothetical protein
MWMWMGILWSLPFPDMWPILYFNNHVPRTMLSSVLPCRWSCGITLLKYYKIILDVWMPQRLPNYIPSTWWQFIHEIMSNFCKNIYV